MKKKIYKNVVQVEILSDEPINLSNYSLSDIDGEITNGEWSGKITTVIENSERKGIGAVMSVKAQGTDPEFFGMDENGDELEDWVDPAGGTHSFDEDDPAMAYE